MDLGNLTDLTLFSRESPIEIYRGTGSYGFGETPYYYYLFLVISVRT